LKHSPDIARTMRLARHLHDLGPRPVYEALVAVEAGGDLLTVLEQYERLSADLMQAMGARELRAPALWELPQ
jgi:hypothetical protein